MNSGIEFDEWTIRKEIVDGEPILRLYIEMKGQADKETVQQKVHNALKELNHDYADYEALIEKRALEVTLLAKGAFHAYSAERAAAGADLARLKPPHMNPSDEIIRTLMKHNQN
jgi:hypothetical protein